MVCTFFGHRDDYGLDIKLLYKTIERLIEDGVDTFYVGNQGHFDRTVLGCPGWRIYICSACQKKGADRYKFGRSGILIFTERTPPPTV